MHPPHKNSCSEGMLRLAVLLFWTVPVKSFSNSSRLILSKCSATEGKAGGFWVDLGGTGTRSWTRDPGGILCRTRCAERVNLAVNGNAESCETGHTFSGIVWPIFIFSSVSTLWYVVRDWIDFCPVTDMIWAASYMFLERMIAPVARLKWFVYGWEKFKVLTELRHEAA